MKLVYSNIRLIKISQPHRVLTSLLKYHIFISYGNEKIPPIDGIGNKLNIFVCNFPFDGYLEFDDPHERWFRLKSHSSYDFIIIDYIFTYELISTLLLQTSLKEITRHQKSYPSIYVLPTPGILPNLFNIDSTIVTKIQTNIKKNQQVTIISIILTSSQHTILSCYEYLSLIPFLLYSIETIQKSFQNIEFHIISSFNNINKTEICQQKITSFSNKIKFIEQQDLQQYYTSFYSTSIVWLISFDPIFILKNITISEIIQKSFLSSSSTTNDSRRWKLFPNIILDYMLNGCIPLVFIDSTTTNLINHTINGFYTQSLNDYITFTLQILKFINNNQLLKLKDNIKNSVSYFTINRFTNSFMLLTKKYLKSKIFRSFTMTSLPILRRKNFLKSNINSKYSVIIIEPHIVNTFEYCVKNLILFLGIKQNISNNNNNNNNNKLSYSQDWKLHIYHSQGNELFVKFILRSIPNVEYHLISYDLTHKNSQNNLLKSSTFWNDLSNNQVEKVLIFQSNSLLLQGNISSFQKYDFLPFFLNNHQNKNENNNQIHKKHSYLHIQNQKNIQKMYDYYRQGTFTLRSVELIKKLIQLSQQNIGNYSNLSELEFYHQLLFIYQNQNLNQQFLIPTKEISQLFCYDLTTPTLTIKQHDNLYDNSLKYPLAINGLWEYILPIESLNYFKLSLQNMISCC